MLAPDAIDIDQTAAHLEGADRRVVLVLDHDACPQPLRQQRPGMRGCRRHRRRDDLMCAFQLGEIKHALASSDVVRSLSPHAPAASCP